MAGKVTVNISNINELQQLETSLKRYEEEFFKVLDEEIKARLISGEVALPVIEETKKILEEMQADYWSSNNSDVIVEDPTALARSEHLTAVTNEILKNFREAASQFSSRGGSLRLIHLSDEFVGTGNEDKKSDQPIIWLHYFLNGNQLEDNLVWINQETYDKLQRVSSGSYTAGHESSAEGLGRFGVGYMACIRNIDGFNKLLKTAKISKTFEELKHPQSGKAGRAWFEGILSRTLNIQETIIQPALDQTKLRVKLKNFIGK
jgi:hypothetical protein